jgi:hypothetical protein
MSDTKSTDKVIMEAKRIASTKTYIPMSLRISTPSTSQNSQSSSHK